MTVSLEQARLIVWAINDALQNSYWSENVKEGQRKIREELIAEFGEGEFILYAG